MSKKNKTTMQQPNDVDVTYINEHAEKVYNGLGVDDIVNRFTTLEEHLAAANVYHKYMKKAYAENRLEEGHRLSLLLYRTREHALNKLDNKSRVRFMAAWKID